MSQEEVVLYNPEFEKGRTLKNLDKTIDFLNNRKKNTYKIRGIDDLEVINRGLKLELEVLEVDDHLKETSSSTNDIEFFISRFVFGHLAQFLKIPSRMYDYYQRFLTLSKDDFEYCCDKEGKILKTLFADRLNDKNKKPNFITVFEDDFGIYPRVIHSSIYYPYKDSKVLNIMIKGFDSINKRYSDSLNYEFEKAFLTPYQSSLYFLNRYTHEAAPTRVGEEIETGLCIQNSECKKASFNFRTAIMRLSCSNGSISRFNKDLSVKHYETNFERKVQLAFTKALELEDQYATKYLKAIEYDNEISDDWGDLIQLPNKFLSMRDNEKKEVIEIGKNQNYNFSPNGIIQAITYKNTNRTHDDQTFERLNEKVNDLIDTAPELQEWRPKRLRALSN